MLSKVKDIATVTQGLSRSGRSSGARPGDTTVAVVSGNNIQDDRIVMQDLEHVALDLDRVGKKHLLQPYDLVMTGKSTVVKAAYVPVDMPRAVANSTMLVIRPADADFGLYLWWFVTSSRGRQLAGSLMVRGSALSTISPRAVGEMEVPLPSRAELRLLARLIEESERAYWAGRTAADLRRVAVRENIIGALGAREGDGNDAD
jgi:hypothetical protein